MGESNIISLLAQGLFRSWVWYFVFIEPILLGQHQHADAAQQAFSSESGPSLHLALPALEALHNAWSSRARKDKYYRFETTLDVAVETIADYYDKTSTSDAFILSMCVFFLYLHPTIWL